MKDTRDPTTIGKQILAHAKGETASQAADRILNPSQNGRKRDPQGIRRPV